ncbi:DsbA family protein [Halomicroarcula sp. GCM10025324]|uniref:DsbA family protein n=1 Tax=Haloarcula TaxID=2237 RepID=UPI0023E8507B|nr:thioredoxin domain-containing protein [Halomicroarcula sp. ZS-22-S1]
MTRPTRRDVLATGVALAGATAGCLSQGSDGGQSPSTTPTGETLPTPVAGDPDADVTVAVFEDYACPHCQTYSVEVYPQIAEAFLAGGAVRYEFHDFPIPVDEAVSWQAASAARAVQDAAGDAAFFTYSKRLFENQASLGPEAYAELTDGLNVDGEPVRQAAVDEQYRPTVAADRQAGIDSGVEGTPTVFVNGDPVEWREIAFEPVRDAIESARGT